MKITWRDAFTNTKTSLENTKEDMKNEVGITESYGEIIFEDENYIALCYDKVPKMINADNFLVIPKGMILKKERK